MFVLVYIYSTLLKTETHWHTGTELPCIRTDIVTIACNSGLLLVCPIFEYLWWKYYYIRSTIFLLIYSFNALARRHLCAATTTIFFDCRDEMMEPHIALSGFYLIAMLKTLWCGIIKLLRYTRKDAIWFVNNDTYLWEIIFLFFCLTNKFYPIENICCTIEKKSVIKDVYIHLSWKISWLYKFSIKYLEFYIRETRLISLQTNKSCIRKTKVNSAL